METLLWTVSSVIVLLKIFGQLEAFQVLLTHEGSLEVNVFGPQSYRVYQRSLLSESEAERPDSWAQVWSTGFCL